MTKASILAFVGCALFLTDCRWFGIKGNGHVTTETRPVSEFIEIYPDGMFDVEWRNGAPSLSITTDENLLPLIKTEVSDNKLYLRTKDRLRPTRGLKVVVSSSKREGAKMRGASDLVARDLSGSSFGVETSGAADVTLDGAVDLLVVDMTGAGELKAKGLQAKTVEISATGAADAEVSVSEALRVTVTGAGDVKYHGNPKTLEKHITGAGDITHKD